MGNLNMAVKAAKKTQTPKKAQPAKKTPTKATKKAENTPSDVKDVVPAETSKTTETPLDSVTHAKAENEGTTQVAPKRTKPLVQDLVGLENITTKCELAEEQVRIISLLILNCSL